MHDFAVESTFYCFEDFIIAATFLKFCIHIANVALLLFVPVIFFHLTNGKRVILMKADFSSSLLTSLFIFYF